MPAHGTLDRVTTDAIDGWAFDPARPDEPVAIAIYDGEVKIASVLADAYRKDLEQAGQGNGRHAFHVSFPKGFFGLPVHRIRVVIAETGKDLRRSPYWLRLEKSDATLAHESWLAAMLANSISAAERQEALEPMARILVNGLDALLRRSDHLRRQNAGRPIGEAVGLFDRAKLPEHVSGLLNQLVMRHPPLHVPFSAEPQISIIVAATGSYADLFASLSAILSKRRDLNCELIVIDISEQTDMLLAPLLLSGSVRFMRLGRQSLMEAYGRGREFARAPVCLFMEAGVLVASGSIARLRDTVAEAGPEAIVAPRLLGSEGRLLEAGRVLGPAAMRTPVGYRASPASLTYRMLRDTDEVPAEIFMAPTALLDRFEAFARAPNIGDWSLTDLCLAARSHAIPVLMQGAAEATLAVDLPLTRSGPAGAQRVIIERWPDLLRKSARLETARARAVVMDARFPEPDQDAGSEAIFSHAKSLKRLGFDVTFLAYDQPRSKSGEGEVKGFVNLLGHGILPLAPLDAAAELALHAGEYDLIYLHRPQTAETMLAACKEHHPSARLLYCPADLLHLRLEREAVLKADASLETEARLALEAERAIASAVDELIVHSSHELALCRSESLHGSPRLVPWTIRMKPTLREFGERSDIGLIGGYRHRPNCDAAIWFATTILPRLRERNPALQLFLAGSHMPPEVTALGLLPGVRVLGFLADLSRLLDRLKLTVAPLRFGAGLKGKVLTSFAAGVPCIMSAVAAEGFDLPSPLDRLVAEDERMDEAILAALQDSQQWQELREAGLRLIQKGYSDQAVDAAFKPLVGSVALAGRQTDHFPSRSMETTLKGEHA